MQKQLSWIQTDVHLQQCSMETTNQSAECGQSDQTTLLKVKIPKWGFGSDALKNHFFVSERTLQWTVLKITIFNLLIIWIFFFHCKEPFEEWISEILHATIDANKEALFLRVYGVQT